MDDDLRVQHICSVQVRPTADGGVTVNGVGLWPDSPKDFQGYTYGTKGPWIARYNFETGHAEAVLREIDDPLPQMKVATLVVLGCVAVVGGILWYLTK